MINLEKAEKYEWGNLCYGWHLLKNNQLGIIQELMPPGTEEKLHQHLKAQQFFYILKGSAVFTIDDKTEVLQANEGIEVRPLTWHKIKNNGNVDLEFLVISEPHSHEDRVNSND